MNKRLIIANLLILTTLTLCGSFKDFYSINKKVTGPTAPQQFNFINQQAPASDTTSKLSEFKDANHNIIVQPVITLDKIQQTYAAQPTNERKTQYINYILDNNDKNWTIEQKIEQTQNIAKVVANDLSLHTGWLYNTDQTQVDWLREQKIKIAEKLYRLEWQGAHWGMHALWYTAVIGTAAIIYLALATVGQNQYAQSHPEYQPLSVGELAWVPFDTTINFANAAAIPAQYVGNAAYQGGAMALTAGKALAGYAQAGVEGIIHKGGQAAQIGVHNAAEYIAHATESDQETSDANKTIPSATSVTPSTPAKTSWWSGFSGWWNNNNQASSASSSTNNQPTVSPAIQAPVTTAPAALPAIVATPANDVETTPQPIVHVPSQQDLENSIAKFTTHMEKTNSDIENSDLSVSNTEDASTQTEPQSAIENNSVHQEPNNAPSRNFNYKSIMDTTPSEMVQNIKSTAQEVGKAAATDALAVETDLHNWLYNLPATPNSQQKYDSFLKELMNQHDLSYNNYHNK